MSRAVRHDPGRRHDHRPRGAGHARHRKSGASPSTARSAFAFGSKWPAGRMQTTAPGATKRASVSTWPSVWSLQRPSPSQRMVVDPERVLETRLDRLFRHRGVAVRMQEALPRRQARPLAVHFDRAAFEDPREAESGELRGFRDSRRHAVVVREHVLTAPAVERERHAGPRAVFPRKEDGRRVAQPDVAERDSVKARAESREGGLRESPVRGVRDEDLEPFAARLAGPGVDVRDGCGERRRRPRAPCPERRPRGRRGSATRARRPRAGPIQRAAGTPRRAESPRPEPCSSTSATGTAPSRGPRGARGGPPRSRRALAR